MSPKFEREYLKDGSIVDCSVERIVPDMWRPHGTKYRLAWIHDGSCRVLYDNHYGKKDHIHIDGVEHEYVFIDIDTLFYDFRATVRSLGGIFYED